MEINSSQKIVPFLWFDGRTEEAAHLYTSIFPDSVIHRMKYWGEGSPFPADAVSMCSFQIAGTQFHAFDAGPQYIFTGAISFFVSCADQDEVDYLWDRLVEGGSPEQCGWLIDKFGIYWQIIPKMFIDILTKSEDAEKITKATQAMMKMVKFDISEIEKAVKS